MTISTYAELKTAVQNWYKDRADIAAYADEFIDLTEAHLSNVLRVRQMETTTTLTPTANVCTLPTDYLEYKRVTENVSPRRALEYITEDAADLLYATRPSGLACHFTIIGSSLRAYPSSANDIELTYYQAIPALSASNTTNWLLTKSPNLYLHCCLLHAAEFVGDDQVMAKEVALVTRHIEILNQGDNRAKFGNAGLYIPGNVW